MVDGKAQLRAWKHGCAVQALVHGFQIHTCGALVTVKRVPALFGVQGGLRSARFEAGESLRLPCDGGSWRQDWRQDMRTSTTGSSSAVNCLAVVHIRVTAQD